MLRLTPVSAACKLSFGFGVGPAVPESVRTLKDFLAWAKANPKRFMYARPTNSGPGRTFMMGLPYILGDKDPRAPGFMRLGRGNNCR